MCSFIKCAYFAYLQMCYACVLTVTCDCIECLFCKNDLTKIRFVEKGFFEKKWGGGGLRLCFGPADLGIRAFSSSFLGFFSFLSRFRFIAPLIFCALLLYFGPQ